MRSNFYACPTTPYLLDSQCHQHQNYFFINNNHQTINVKTNKRTTHHDAQQQHKTTTTFILTSHSDSLLISTFNLLYLPSPSFLHPSNCPFLLILSQTTHLFIYKPSISIAHIFVIVKPHFSNPSSALHVMATHFQIYTPRTIHTIFCFLNSTWLSFHFLLLLPSSNPQPV